MFVGFVCLFKGRYIKYFLKASLATVKFWIEDQIPVTVKVTSTKHTKKVVLI